jgi:hypothetical protein
MVTSPIQPVERPLLQGSNVPGLAVDVGEAVAGAVGHQFALHLRVAQRLARAGSQVVAQRQVARLLVAACRADMEVKGARTRNRLAEEMEVGRVGVRAKR